MRVIRTKRPIKISDSKTLPTGAIGRVEGVIVEGRSVQAYFGCGFGSLPISESDVEDVSVDELQG